MLIAVCSQSKLVSNADVNTMTMAVQNQLNLHVFPAWNMKGGTIEFHSDPTTVPPNAWVVNVMDNPTQADALGYHSIDNDMVDAFIFAEPVLSNGGVALCDNSNPNNVSVASVLSHEVCEMVGDIYANSFCDHTDGKSYALELCFTGDTLIPLLDGTKHKIEDLAKLSEFWVYGCTPDGRIVPARGHSARMTRKNAEIVAVELDNGEIIKCTPDHLFMLRDGSYLPASQLTEGTSLMPLYRKKDFLRNNLDYEQIMMPATKEWEYTHRIVAPDCPSGSVRHHKDFNRFNNEPSNIQVMRANEHIELHAQNAKNLIAAGKHPFQNPSPEKRERDRIRMIEYNKSEEHREIAREVGRKNMLLLWDRPEFRENHSKRASELISNYNGSEKQKADYNAYINDPIRFDAAIAKSAESNRKPYASKIHSDTIKKYQDSLTQEEKSDTGKYGMHVRWHENRNQKNENCNFCIQETIPNNHKVVSVKPAGYSDVWDITVDETHNFALEAGVFVHNCDPVESDSYIVNVGSTPVSVSNFVYPSFFNPQAQACDAPFDYLKKLTAPFTMTKGGYMIYRTGGEGTEQQIFGEEMPEWKKEMKMSKYYRR
jgi:hypothetical protein